MRWTVLAFCLLAAGCKTSSATHAGVDRNCIPGTVVFCNCAGGFETGTQACLPAGEGFGLCEPCTEIAGEDAEATDEPDVFTEPDAPETPDDAADVLEEDSAPDAAADGGVSLSPGGTCPGPLLKLEDGVEVQITGSTAATLSNTGGLGVCAVGANSHDAAFALQIPARGRLSVAATGLEGFDPVVYLRSGTCAGSQLACANATKAWGLEKLQVFVKADDLLHLFVDGPAGESGPFQLKVQFEAGSWCGDATIDPEEACDDGNSVNGDGCSAFCQPDGAPAEAASCPGQTIHVWTLPVEVSATTVKFANTYKASCGGGSGRDATYAVMAHRTGKLVATIGQAEFDTVLFARAAQCTTGVEVGCSNDAKGVQGGDTMSVPVIAGATVFVFVDGFKYGKGGFHLKLQVQ